MFIINIKLLLLINYSKDDSNFEVPWSSFSYFLRNIFNSREEFDQTSVSLVKCNSKEADPNFSRKAMIYKYRRNLEEILIYPWIYKKKHEFVRILDIPHSYIYRYIRTKIEYVYMSAISTRNMSIQHANAVKCRAMKTNEEKFQRHASPPSLNAPRVSYSSVYPVRHFKRILNNRKQIAHQPQ